MSVSDGLFQTFAIQPRQPNDNPGKSQEFARLSPSRLSFPFVET